MSGKVKHIDFILVRISTCRSRLQFFIRSCINTMKEIIEASDIYGLTPGEVKDRKICATRGYNLNITRGCLRFNDLTHFTVSDSFLVSINNRVLSLVSN